MRIGYTLSSEEFDPLSLIRFAQLAEDAGFSFLSVSDHFHPWVDEQGESPFVWNVIGALSQVTHSVKVLVGVNCPIIRYHPAIVAQAAATSQYMLQGRFILGVGTGENLNEHVVGQGWPPASVRLEMLEEAILIMRKLWQGGYQTHFGKFFNLDAGRIYTLPETSIPIIISAMGEEAAQVAGNLGDGFITTSPNQDLILLFESSGGKGKPKFGQLNVCFDKNPEKAKEIMKKEWPLAGMPHPLNTELRLPQDFQNTAQLVRVEDATKNVPTGADPQSILESIQKYIDAGFSDIYIHNIGPNQEEFIEFASREILSKFREAASRIQEQIPQGPIVFSHTIRDKY